MQVINYSTLLLGHEDNHHNTLANGHYVFKYKFIYKSGRTEACVCPLIKETWENQGKNEKLKQAQREIFEIQNILDETKSRLDSVGQ